MRNLAELVRLLSPSGCSDYRLWTVSKDPTATRAALMSQSGDPVKEALVFTMFPAHSKLLAWIS